MTLGGEAPWVRSLPRTTGIFACWVSLEFWLTAVERTALQDMFVLSARNISVAAKTKNMTLTSAVWDSVGVIF